MRATADKVLEEQGVWKALAEFRNGNYSELALVNAVLRAIRNIEQAPKDPLGLDYDTRQSGDNSWQP